MKLVSIEHCRTYIINSRSDIQPEVLGIEVVDESSGYRGTRNRAPTTTAGWWEAWQPSLEVTRSC